MAKRVQIDQPAPDFSLTDANGQQISLSDFKNKRNALLVFNRGFI
ncbi:MAG: redoxin domain-containing protein [Anaerolineales bacterium]|nr:redoxin domain-containing protein [Anaerolineales bacterium]